MIDEITRLRTEIKRLCPPAAADSVASFLSRRLAHPRESRVTTLYLDRPDGGLSLAARSSPGLNVKVRLRAYFTADGAPESPFVWLEIKRRAGKSSEKDRLRLDRRMVGPVLEGDDLWPQIMDSQEEDQFPAEILRVYEEIRGLLPERAQVVGAVHFWRLSFEAEQPRVRVTFDRAIRYHAVPGWIHDVPGARALGAPLACEDAGIVEIKYAGHEPSWRRDLSKDLVPTDHSKFLTLLGHVDRLRRD